MDSTDTEPATRPPAGDSPAGFDGIASKIALFAGVSTLFTASLLSAVAIHSTRALIASVPGQPNAAALHWAVTRLAIIDFCIVVLFSLLAYRVTQRMMRPITQLSEVARRAARGEADLELPELSGRDEMGALSRALADMIDQHRIDREQIEAVNRDLRDKNLRLEQNNEVLNQLSITDGLTKLHNHRFFQDHLTREIRRVERAGSELSILLLDIDDFKRLNDRQGHAAGDEVLRGLAKIMREQVRSSDLCARYGGEEFVVLMPDTDVAGAYRLAEKLRNAIEEASFIVGDSMRPLRVTVSIGVAAFGGKRKGFFEKADQALYRAKADGKNCVVVHPDDVPAEA